MNNPCLSCSIAPNCNCPCEEKETWMENERKQEQEIGIVEKFTRKPTVMVMSIRDNKILHLTTVLAAVKTILSGDWNEEDPKKLISKALEVLYTEAGIETFDEIFVRFDAWYWDKYRHHPEEMLAKEFYKFLNLAKEGDIL